MQSNGNEILFRKLTEKNEDGTRSVNFTELSCRIFRTITSFSNSVPNGIETLLKISTAWVVSTVHERYSRQIGGK